ncbi:hypothetical protein [Metabacillus fastidiosus]|uniref:hypothetical protein n=1 Tax=Metabacillus fastidiosus TaxID=1458 RepID=UPI003D2C53F8
MEIFEYQNLAVKNKNNPDTIHYITTNFHCSSNQTKDIAEAIKNLPKMALRVNQV